MDITTEFYEETDKSHLGALVSLGDVYTSMRAYERAENILLVAKNICEKHRMIDHPAYSVALSFLAVIYSNTDQPKKAVFNLKEALKLEKKQGGENSPYYLVNLVELGREQQKIKAYDESIQTLEKATELFEKNNFTDQTSYMIALNLLGINYSNQKNYAKAENLQFKALAIISNKLGKNSARYIWQLSDIAQLYIDQNQLDEAWKYLSKAIQVNTGIRVNSDFNQNTVDSILEADIMDIRTFNSSLHILFKLSKKNATANTQQQLQIVQLALDLLERRKTELISDGDKILLFRENAVWVETYLELLEQNNTKEEAFNILEQNKSILLLDAVSTKKAYTKGLLPDSLIQKEKTLQNEYNTLKADLAKPRSRIQKDSLRLVLSDIDLKLNSFRKELKAKYPKYATMRYEHDASSIQQIQATLPEKTALIEYFVGKSAVYVFNIEKNRITTHSHSIQVDTLSEKIRRLQQSLSNYDFIKEDPKLAYQDYTQNAAWFYQHLLAPVLSTDSDLKQLIIIPDGELGHLPFETFLVEKAPSTEETNYEKLHYLIQDYAISYNYSATLWNQNYTHKKKNNNGQMLAVASNYEFQLDSAQQYLRIPADSRKRSTLIPLDAARNEVEYLSEQYGGTFLFDSLASEQNFKTQASQFGILHLAMHGLLDTREPVLSSLAFTENGDSVENNFLHAYEITQLELNADLVVLSACETGYGRFERGNGIASLARAFMYAGTPSLVVSLWKVNDGSTKVLMRFFYKNLAKGMSKDQALRQAKLSYLVKAKDRAAHPAFWSPFITMGSTKPIQLQQKEESKWHFWLIGAGGIVLGGTLLMRRRKKAA